MTHQSQLWIHFRKTKKAKCTGVSWRNPVFCAQFCIVWVPYSLWWINALIDKSDKNRNKWSQLEIPCRNLFTMINFLNFFLLKDSWFTICVNFCCTAKWLSYTYIYILFYILFHHGLFQDIEYSSLCYTVGPCCFSILHLIVCIY